MESSADKKRTASEAAANEDEGRRSATPEPARKKKKIDPVSKLTSHQQTQDYARILSYKSHCSKYFPRAKNLLFLYRDKEQDGNPLVVCSKLFEDWDFNQGLNTYISRLNLTFESKLFWTSIIEIDFLQDCHLNLLVNLNLLLSKDCKFNHVVSAKIETSIFHFHIEPNRLKAQSHISMSRLNAQSFTKAII